MVFFPAQNTAENTLILKLTVHAKLIAAFYKMSKII